MMKIPYKQVGDYLIPELVLPKQPEKTLGKYGRMRIKYMKEHHKGLYAVMLLNGTLVDQLHEVDEAAYRKLEHMMPEMVKKASISENIKADDPMKWIGLMNVLKAQVEGIILDELIYN